MGRAAPRRPLAAAALLAALAGSASPAFAQAPAFTPQEERVEDLPPGPGRDETFALCSACHAYRLVSSQGMTRERWDETLTFMTQRHNMPDIQGEERDLILDYLERAHPPKPATRAGGFKNPFLE